MIRFLLAIAITALVLIVAVAGKVFPRDDEDGEYRTEMNLE